MEDDVGHSGERGGEGEKKSECVVPSQSGFEYRKIVIFFTKLVTNVSLSNL
jgi:hypothetical protein